MKFWILQICFWVICCTNFPLKVHYKKLASPSLSLLSNSFISSTRTMRAGINNWSIDYLKLLLEATQWVYKFSNCDMQFYTYKLFNILTNWTKSTVENQTNRCAAYGRDHPRQLKELSHVYHWHARYNKNVDGVTKTRIRYTKTQS